MNRIPGLRRKSGFSPPPKPAELLRFAPDVLGQCCPQRCPSQGATGRLPLELPGAPLSIRETARLIGCSPWTVRQKLVPMGLPVFRSGAGGKLIFYTNQVVRWLEFRQGENT
ncbi:MAG: hypothetical protein ACRD4P_01755 [Bryobacteraceae bacterium]